MESQEHDPFVKRWERFERKVSVAATCIYVLVPLMAGFLASLVSEFGRGASQAFFSVVAEGLLPVLLVAAVVQWALLAQRRIALDTSDLMEREIAHEAVGFFCLFVIGEGMALYAVATEASSTFLVVGALVAALLLLAEMLIATRHQFGESFKKYLPSKVVQDSAERDRRERAALAETLEARAKSLRAEIDSGSVAENSD